MHFDYLTLGHLLSLSPIRQPVQIHLPCLHVFVLLSGPLRSTWVVWGQGMSWIVEPGRKHYSPLESPAGNSSAGLGKAPWALAPSLTGCCQVQSCAICAGCKFLISVLPRRPCVAGLLPVFLSDTLLWPTFLYLDDVLWESYVLGTLVLYSFSLWGDAAFQKNQDHTFTTRWPLSWFQLGVT